MFIAHDWHRTAQHNTSFTESFFSLFFQFSPIRLILLEITLNEAHSHRRQGMHVVCIIFQRHVTIFVFYGGFHRRCIL